MMVYQTVYPHKALPYEARCPLCGWTSGPLPTEKKAWTLCEEHQPSCPGPKGKP